MPPAVDALTLADGTLLVHADANAVADVLLATVSSAQPPALRVALVRAVFLADGAPLPPLASLLRPLGHGVIALAATAVQRPREQRHVDEWTASDGAGAPELSARAVALPLYLTQRGFQLRVVPDVAAAPAAESSAVQSTRDVLMVAPTAFASNAQAAADNTFMAAAARDGALPLGVRDAVLDEYAGLHSVLTNAGVRVRLFAHTEAHGTPDAVFPNNWFSLSGGVLVLYPMKCSNRAAERRDDIVAQLRALPSVARVLDLSEAERGAPPAALEGTGVLVLDHLRRVAYMARSERSDDSLAHRAAAELGFERVHAFDATDDAGRPVYHTNVMLAIGTGFAVVCADAVADEVQRAALLEALALGGREVVRISRAQMGAMCGNVLELRNAHGLPVLALSSRAHSAFDAAQRAALLRHTAELLHAPVDTLEAVGGGSVRCCLAELFGV